jgi:hypothetical protein
MDSRLLTGIGIGVVLGAMLVLSLLGLASLMDDSQDVLNRTPSLAAAPPSTPPVSAAPPSPIEPAASAAQEQPPAAAEVSINGRRLSPGQMAELAALYGVEPVPGHYWYDAMSGLYGVMGQPSEGFMYPAHDFGRLGADSSAGHTGVFLNGRNLPQSEVMLLSALWGSYIEPARYWLDGQGNVGDEGVPVPVGNLYAQAAAHAMGGGSGGAGGGDNFWNSRFSAGNYNADNTSGYVGVPGIGPVGYGLD